MKNAGRSAQLKPVSNDFARNRRIALYPDGTVVCHQHTLEDGITAKRNPVAGSDNVEQNLVPLQSDQVNMRVAF